ncbi:MULTISPECIES: hypothetical protein [Ensifer]|jgi:hypothetical protein|uniref:Uncharacterized protein n=1 Tax=Ensifer canadensis TaxID=555315 RepID=A0AAW4FFJ6_9HYPH|nr:MULTISPECIES: hypothetical protein [Ensifer]MDP9628801.1 hypothetical protein [Ensifer adhaerens]KQU98416.1 hypothetical protein ASD00_01870 [Ensifer sp. Root31]KQW63175.1 hypothetical protein ASD02_03505 [Ensifer sp. Root1252]KQW85191.1 hypothetical protein ASD03_05700 [Ensifer sp. Root127]KQY71049.1 hypothetical protein ASD52_04875 [Ensifer sp. Root142]
MIIIATVMLGMLVAGLRSPRTCLFVAGVLSILAGAGGDWVQVAAAIGGYNMGIALTLCGAIVAGVHNG